MSFRWLRIRGGPSVRQFGFEKARAAGEFGQRIDEVLARVELLILGHGAFHAKVHFSTGKVTLWLLHDPLRYRVHVKEEFLDPEFILAYPRLPYTTEALVPLAGICEGARRIQAPAHA